ncbi:E2F/DP winged-helix DNA-binding domain [Castilleja foliolosa]|uniref:E2F/DP winged-helix DNA-binding domain n=1 Tax=Castilleja foliolosa TaxID=1961234 RepID=A0ABD3DX27_9LAMI
MSWKALILSRKAKNRYTWKGFGAIPEALEALKKAGLRENGQSADTSCYEKVSDDDEDDIVAPKTGDNRKEKSLGLLTQNFVKHFLCTDMDMISLDDAAKLLLGDGKHTLMTTRTKVRRLYDIANVLSSMKFIEKTHHPETRKPAFRWLGLNGKPQNGVPNNSGSTESKKRVFGADITNVAAKRFKVDEDANHILKPHNPTRQGLCPSELGLVLAFGCWYCIIIDADDYKNNVDDLDVPMFVHHTEAMMEEIDRMDAEIEMEDVDDDAEDEPVVDIDNGDRKNPVAVTEYIDDLYAHYKRAESSRNFTCEARITRIHENRGWYYVLCSKCPNKLYQELNNDDVLYVCKDDDDVDPNFRYCVNATITDATGSTEAVFFNESMQMILNISCKDMVTKYGQPSDPRHVPEILRSIADTPRLLHLTLKNDGQIVVNNISDVAQSSDIQSTETATGATAFSPTTPLPKSNTSKRQLLDTPGTEKRQRHA